MDTVCDSVNSEEYQLTNELQNHDAEGTFWKFWCRLCAKDRPDNICIYDAKSFTLTNYEIALTIDKHFSSNFRIKEQNLPENLCKDCYGFIKKLMDFEKRIEEVQELFSELISCSNSINETLSENDDKREEFECSGENDFIPTSCFERNPLEIIDETTEKVCEEILEIEKIPNDLDKIDESHSSSENIYTIAMDDSKDDYKYMKAFKGKIYLDDPLNPPEGNRDNQKLVKCPQCTLKLLPSSLNAHIKKIHIDGLQYLCEECGKAYSTLHSLEEHKIIHTNSAPHVCSYCPRSFKKLPALNRHIQYVHDPNKYFCKLCNAEFKSNLTLKNHMITHSKSRPFKCDFCGYSFRHARNLKVHLLAHTGLKLYQCDICNRSYGSATTLRSHKKKMHPEELAAQEAMGAKRLEHPVPNIAYLRALTKTANGLKPLNRRGLKTQMVDVNQEKV